MFNRASVFLDRALRHFATEVPPFIQDTNDFSQKLKDVRIPSHTILASFDVVSVYTSIDIMEGVEAVKK